MTTPGGDVRRPTPESPSVTASLRLWQWALGIACGIAVVVAIGLSASDPSLTYEPVDQSDGTVTVQCRSDDPTLATARRMPRHFEITSGEDVFEQWQDDGSEQAAGQQYVDVFAEVRGVNADCARADTARLHTTMWVLAGGVALGFGFVWVSLERRRSGSGRGRPLPSPDATDPESDTSADTP